MAKELTTKEILELRKKHIGPSVAMYFKQDPLHVVRGAGAYLYDVEGNEHLDCINNVANVGHSHPDVTKACADQMGLLCTNSRYLHSNMAALGKKIADTMPEGLNVCYFVNSGSEANDLALQMAQCYSGQKEVICMDDAYHGTVRSVQIISPHKWKQIKQLESFFKAENCHVVPVPDTYRGKYRSDKHTPSELSHLYTQEVENVLDDLKAKGRGPSAFILESMQSCGGQIIYPPSYLNDTFKLVKNAGGLCIADEVQTGCGRVGTHWWAFQTYPGDVRPDIVTIGKPLGNGHPISAVVTTREVADRFVLPYFNTFGGNPVSCAIALACFDVMEKEKLRSKALVVGEYLLKKMEELKSQHQLVGDVRGRGLFVGVDLVTDRVRRTPATAEAKYIISRIKNEGVILSRDGPAENVLKFKPPLCFSMENVDTVYKKLHTILTDVEMTESAILDTPEKTSSCNNGTTNGRDRSDSGKTEEQSIRSERPFSTSPTKKVSVN